MSATFIIIGEQKCGTGWLRDRLREHPQVHCHHEEVDFFNSKRNYARGLAWYSRLLASKDEVAARGEKSADYFWINRPSGDYFANPLENIARDLPEARIVLCLRNPVDRAVSAFNHHLYHRGRRIDPRLTRRHTLEELLFDSCFAIAEEYGILQRGFYAERLRIAGALFGSRLLTLLFEEDIVRDPLQGLRAVCNHLGVRFMPDRFRLSDNAKESKPSYPEILIGHHAQFLRPVLRRLRLGAAYRVSPDARARARLRSLYAEDTTTVMGMLHRPSAQWPPETTG